MSLGVGYTWLPDSKSLAVTIRKENEEKLELLVYAIEDRFRLLHHQDLEQIRIDDLSWDGVADAGETPNMVASQLSIFCAVI